MKEVTSDLGPDGWEILKDCSRGLGDGVPCGRNRAGNPREPRVV